MLNFIIQLYYTFVNILIMGGLHKIFKAVLCGFSLFLHHKRYTMSRNTKLFACESKLFLGGCLNAYL